MNKFIFLLFLSLLLSGCGPKYQLIQNPDVLSEDAGKLIIYRPDGFFHKHNPEEPFVYLNGKKIGTLGVGETLETQVAMGKNIILMKHNMLSLPTFELGTVELNVETKDTYYVRYSYDFKYAVGTTPVGDSVLQQVDAGIGELRK